jgi:uncharacterized protein with FMN-binding domain
MKGKSTAAIGALGAMVLAGVSGQAHAASTTVTYKGTVIDTRYGPIEAVIKVKSKKITNVKVLASPDSERSEFLVEQASPILKQEVLQAQSAKIDLVTGATVSSEAFVMSLKTAIKKAKKAHNLA